MRKTFLTDATILSIFDYQNDNKIFLGKVLFGICVEDETNSFDTDDRVFTSLIESNVNFEYITSDENCYVTDDKTDNLELRLLEFLSMRDFLLSPLEILEARLVLEYAKIYIE